MGVSTNRDEWVYDFEVANLRNKVLFFARPLQRTARQKERSQMLRPSNGVAPCGAGFDVVNASFTTMEIVPRLSTVLS